MNPKLIYVKDFLSLCEAQALLDSLVTLPWSRGKFMGNAVPRDEVWIGPFPYEFSGRTLQPHPITPEIKKLQERIEEEFSGNYNSCLLNRYVGGKDSVAWHADDEDEMDDAHQIASVSLGAARNFVIREVESKDKKTTFVLANGSLIIMPPGFQETHEHCVPKTKAVIGTRINLPSSNQFPRRKVPKNYASARSGFCTAQRQGRRQHQGSLSTWVRLAVRAKRTGPRQVHTRRPR
jgi:alkylated DNA repair dioxygenase AlkB